MPERRRTPRKRIDVFFNKYVEGHPYLCRAIDLSGDGLRALTHVEPERQAESLPLELRLPGDDRSLWIWARSVRREQGAQSFEFRGLKAADRSRLSRWLQAPAQ